MTDFVGTTGNDRFIGGDGDDTFDMSQGGKDIVRGGDGADLFNFGATLNGNDKVDGGAGFDILTIQGDYSAGITLEPSTLHGIERLSFLAGFDYRVYLANGDVDRGTQLDLSNDHGANSIYVNASAMVNGGSIYSYSVSPETVIGSQSGDNFQEFTTHFVLDGQGGDDTVTAFSGIDRFSKLDGGDGTDTFNLSGPYAGVMTSHTLRHVEVLNLDSGDDITFFNSVVAAGATMTLSAGGVSHLDASAETTGHYVMNGSAGDDTLIGGRSADTLIGGAGDDLITGNMGGDVLTGGDGADSFMFTTTRDSTQNAPDLITDFNPAQDHIDLSAIDARTDKARDQPFHLVSAFTHVAGQLVLTYDSAADVTHVLGDVNGDGKADLDFDVAGHLTDTTGFVL